MCSTHSTFVKKVKKKLPVETSVVFVCVCMCVHIHLTEIYKYVYINIIYNFQKLYAADMFIYSRLSWD